jgi:hypothetical protein
LPNIANDFYVLRGGIIQMILMYSCVEFI